MINVMQTIRITCDGAYGSGGCDAQLTAVVLTLRDAIDNAIKNEGWDISFGYGSGSVVAACPTCKVI